MSKLFSPLKIKDTQLKNRIGVPPMCQYMAEDGFVNDWHKVHYGALARGGSGLIVLEATGVSPEGRISPNCLGIWKDEHIEGLREVASLIKSTGAVAGIQIAHAGRKASAHRPWDGDDHISNDDPKGWQTIAPSPIAFGHNLPKVPKEMTIEDIKRVQSDFVEGAKRAVEAGFQWIELHFAHGYLAQSFTSKHSNKREDQYGGSLENRGRFANEIISAVKAAIPQDIPLSVRFGVIEYDGNDEETLQESITLLKNWKQLGIDHISVSVRFTIAEVKIPWGPAFLGDIAKRVRQEVGLPVSSAWGFGEPEIASKAVESEQLDQVLVGNAHLANPNWAYHAAKTLGEEKAASLLPDSYSYWLARYRSPGEKKNK